MLENKDSGYKDKSFYIDLATIVATKEYPNVDLSKFEGKRGSPTVTRRSGLKSIYSKDQVSVIWQRITDDEKYQNRNNPIPMERLSVDLNRGGKIYDHNYSVTEAWMNWMPRLPIKPIKMQNKSQ